jgi:sugar lactone lactonase YvrE
VSRSRLSASICLALGLLIYVEGVRAAEFPTPEDFVTVSGVVSPRVAFALQRDASGIGLVVEAASTVADGGDVSVSVGLAAAQKVVLTPKEATVRKGGGATRFAFRVPAASLAPQEADWARLRMGLAVAWSGGALGQDRQRERFRHAGGAPHAGLSPDPADWLPLDLAAHEAMVRDLRNRVWVEFDQPMAGKGTVVIEDEAGRRVRNLVSGAPFTAGRQRVEWDGLDEDGKIVAPGAYRWRSIHHPGIAPAFLFSFCNDGSPGWRTGTGTDMWGPDHSALTAAAAGREWAFFGGSCSESGYAMVAVDAQGVKRMHYNAVHGTGIEKVALAAEGDVLYAAHDGFAWGQHVDRSKAGWKAEQKITITRFDAPGGRVVEFPGGRKFVEVVALEVGPGSANKGFTGHNLGGLAAAGGRLYVSCRASHVIAVLDAKTGARTGEIKLESPGPLAVAGASLLAVSGTAVVTVDPATGAATPRVPAGRLEPAGIAADAAGGFYVSDAKTHQVHAFDAAGKPVRVLGKPGGPYVGTYDPERMVNPAGLVMASNGWLWVTEERWTPKRLAAWDPKTGKVVKEKFGPTAYGAPGAGFDTADPGRWVGQGASWQLDFASKSAACRSILGYVPGSLMHWRFLRQDGRTFLYGSGQSNTLCEWKADGSIRPLACFGSAHHFSYSRDWNPPAAFVEAFNKAYPQQKYRAGQDGRPPHGPGVLWVDRSGDGEMQAEEFEFSTGASAMGSGSWGHDLLDLTIRVPVTVGGKPAIAVLKPDGFDARGVPKYPRLQDAVAAAVPLRDLPPLGYRGIQVESAVDRRGNVILKTDPAMTCFAPDGSLRWRYPNRWSDVHGSHDAPLPETGVMQGTLFFLGMAPLDEQSDVTILNGNHGRFFVLTSDGLYLDEMFKDVRMGGALDATLIGGECFGGFFARSERDGAYYLQSGHTDYRIFRIHGLDRVKRGQGTVAVSAAQAVAADNRLKRRASEARAAREAVAPFRPKPPAIDGHDNDWPGEAAVRWDKSGQFPVRVRLAYDDTCLYLHYTVADPSPWVNNGKDGTLLFKTGDSVDLQLGTDPGADPKRTGPAPGDLRLLIAPFEGKDVAVLYRHRVPGAKDPVTFTCPWRSEKVDVVKRLEAVRVAVVKEGGQHKLEAAVPLADLGLAAPGGKTLKADVGVIYGDPDGTVNMLRSYWANPATGLVNDVPGEIMLSPNLWGSVRFEAK